MDNQDKAPTEAPPTDLIQFVEDITQNTDNGDLVMDSIPEQDKSDVESVGRMFEHCIDRVSRLEMRREELIQEFLFLQEPMKRAVDHLRGKLAVERRLVTLAQVDHMDVFEDVQKVKRKLFNTARACIHSQVTLAEQEYKVAQAAITKSAGNKVHALVEICIVGLQLCVNSCMPRLSIIILDELKAKVQCLKEELLRLQESHQNHLSSLRDLAKKPRRPRTMSDVGLCRQASVNLQRRLSVSIQDLEGWYEPRLVALLKRRQFGEKALRVSNEQLGSLRTQVDPLKQKVQKLEGQRSCLEQRLNMMQQEREEMITQYKEAEDELKEALRRRMLDFEIQLRHKRDLEALTNDILEEIARLRSLICSF
ncbi:syncoilin-like isoform X1 [Syngnathoides biaculeatus]|uniref:syncoilin-like isoform X1 n=1 Tax=Syngnathoides biaculeatus TaxID=300417 RepID=UPI002ADD7FFF|nr:syncoilin-like isoform X1 [Syngnathoides biaculeatus]XP_061699056.1 syncoilin-like isoform X1 [Syngnathoides biaculeatus]